MRIRNADCWNIYNVRIFLEDMYRKKQENIDKKYFLCILKTDEEKPKIRICTLPKRLNSRCGALNTVVLYVTFDIIAELLS
jgi:hypothetical protein